MIKLSLKISIILFIFFFSQLITSIYANNIEDLNLPTTKINPGNFYYNFKRLWEKGMDKLQFRRESRINFYQSLLKIRLAELNYVVEKKLLGEVQQSTERFAYTAGKLTDELVRQNKSSENEKVTGEFEKIQIFLERLRDKYPANTSFWMLVQHDINTLEILSDRLK